MKTLVVDDLAENRYFLEQLLRAKGHSVVTAGGGHEALEQLAAQHFDLIISDVLMPQMDGFEFCFNVRLDPKHRDVPFVFYTATYTSEEDRRFALSLGADAFILKPQEPREFVESLREILANAGNRPVATLAPHLSENHLVFFKEYNARLIQKLEQKVAEVREANERLLAANASLESRVAEKTRDLQRSNHELEVFASTVTHDLRTPLRTIAGYADALGSSANERLIEQEKQWLEKIESAVERADQIIDDVLEYSRIATRPPALERIDVGALVREVIQGSPDFEDYVEVRPPLYPVIGHAPSLRQALVNLLGNSVKFVAAGVIPRVVVRSELRENGVRLWIDDNGLGIPAEAQAKIFEPFERLDSSFQGSGLGLAIVHRAVERMRGSVGVESELGKGSRFWIQLPASQP